MRTTGKLPAPPSLKQMFDAITGLYQQTHIFICKFEGVAGTLGVRNFSISGHAKPICSVREINGKSVQQLPVNRNS